MPLNHPSLCWVLVVTRIIMRGVVPINTQLLVSISAPASDERSSGSRHAALTIVSPSTMVPAPPLTRVMCPATPSPSRHRGAGRVSRHLHTLSGRLSTFTQNSDTITPFQIGSFNLLEYFFILNIHYHYYHWGLYEVRPGQHTNWHK